MLKEILSDCGCTPDSLFGDKWDQEDMFAESEQNQNLLAWFGYEEVCNSILNSLE